MLITRPRSFAAALALALRMGRRADRPLPVHLVYLAEACCIARWLRAAEIRHVYAHFGTNSAEVAMLAECLGGPSWSFTVHGPEEFDKAPILGLAEKIRHCSFVVAVSSFGRSQLFRLVGHDLWSKVQVIRCGLTMSFSARRRVTYGASARLCRPLVRAEGAVASGRCRTSPRKAGSAFRTRACGGRRVGEIEMLLQRHGIEDRVRITGWLSGPEVRREILAAQALVLPSFAEGLPVVLMEAMALRRAVISTYIAGIPELVRSGSMAGWCQRATRWRWSKRCGSALTARRPRSPGWARRDVSASCLCTMSMRSRRSLPP